MGCIFLSLVLLNEGMSHKQTDTYDRVGWFQMASIYLMKIRVTNESHPVGPGIKLFGRKAAGERSVGSCSTISC
jgi:hypothetical protein